MAWISKIEKSKMMEMGEPPVAKFECLNCKYSDHRMSAREVGELTPGECPKCSGDLKVVSRGPPEWLVEPLKLVGEYFGILDFIASKDRMELEVTARDPKRSFRSLLTTAKRRGYLPVLRGREDELKLLVMKQPPISKENIAVNFLLLGATILSTFTAGYFLLFDRNPLYASLFSGAIMLMLSTHEFGHKIAARHNGVESTLPYFIPVPFLPLGTLGAVIKIKSPIPTKEALVEMGASGPIFGFLVALPLTTIGLMLSKPDPEGISLWFVPAIFAVLQLFTLGHMPAMMDLNPLAFAGWVMLVVTMLNLLPAGQFDGGHVARGLLDRERHYALTRTLGFSLILFGFLFPFLFFFGFIILFVFRGYHTGALDDVSELSKHQRSLAALTFIVFLLCLPLPVG